VTSDRNALYQRLICWLAAALCLSGLSWPANAQEAAVEATGADLWRQAGCFSCHGNLADGAGDPAYPVGPNLRRSGLDLEMLIQTIACGRPSTPMPMFLEGAYAETPCYGIPVGAVPDGVNVGGNFSTEEIALLADFLVANVLGQARITRENCGAFFNGNVDAPLCRQY
jgi:hypothetical protein